MAVSLVVSDPAAPLDKMDVAARGNVLIRGSFHLLDRVAWVICSKLLRQGALGDAGEQADLRDRLGWVARVRSPLVELGPGRGVRRSFRHTNWRWWRCRAGQPVSG